MLGSKTDFVGIVAKMGLKDNISVYKIFCN